LERLHCDKTTEQGHDEVYYILAGVDGAGQKISARGPNATQGAVADDQTAWDMNDSGKEKDQTFNAVLYEGALDANQTASFAFSFLESDHTNPGDQIKAAAKLVETIGEDLKQPVLVLAGKIAEFFAGLIPTNQDDFLGNFQLRLHNDPSYPNLVVEAFELGIYTTILDGSNLNNGHFTLQFKHDGAVYAAYFRVEPVRAIHGASFVSQVVPSQMVPGQRYPVSVTLKNTGADTWTTEKHYALGSQNPQDNNLWQTSGRSAVPGAVPPDSAVTFQFTLTAPSAPGTYDFQTRLVQDGVEWFGDYTPNVRVQVAVPENPSCPAIRSQISTKQNMLQALMQERNGLNIKFPGDKVRLQEINREITQLQGEIAQLRQQSSALGCHAA
jgi:Ig-like domain from next to BRCA1 gene